VKAQAFRGFLRGAFRWVAVGSGFVSATQHGARVGSVTIGDWLAAGAG